MEMYSKLEMNVECDFEGNLYCEKLIDDSAGLTLFLTGSRSDQWLCVNFDTFYCYRNTNESYRLVAQDEIPNDQYLVLKVENSKFLSWLHTESREILSRTEIFHYMVVAEDYIIDVLSGSAPSANIIEKESIQPRGKQPRGQSA